MSPARIDPVENFWNKVSPEPMSGCWLWTGSMLPTGYGNVQLYRGGKHCSIRAHRFSYELLVGAIPRGLELDHLCRVRSCVNPAHLEPVTRSVNILRGDLPAVLRAKSARRTHCSRGHEFTESNTYLWRGHKCCRLCHSVRQRAYTHKQLARRDA